MQVAITGATGLIGSALHELLVAEGHDVTRIRRGAPAEVAPDISWDIQAGRLNPSDLVGIDAVVHLAGEGIGDHRWTNEQKRKIRESRTNGTALIARTLAEMDNGPTVLVSASAIGYYGDRGEEALTEESAPGEGFLPSVCVDWEASAEPARTAGLRVVHPRLGIVLTPNGGAMAKLLPLFRLGLGGRFGNGRQYWPWVTIDDVCGALLHALITPDLAGPVNVTAPTPVSNAEFTRTLGRVLGRPTLLPVPAFGPKLLMGELADALLFDSARVLPERLEISGYTFAHPNLEGGLRHLLDR